jgi:hypothetical protein
MTLGRKRKMSTRKLRKVRRRANLVSREHREVGSGPDELNQQSNQQSKRL